MRTKSQAGRESVEYLTITQFAEELMVSERTVSRLRDAGELHAHKVGRQWRISRDDANAFMAVRRK
jgi:excisionase family DNA binding protein